MYSISIHACTCMQYYTCTCTNAHLHSTYMYTCTRTNTHNVHHNMYNTCTVCNIIHVHVQMHICTVHTCTHILVPIHIMYMYTCTIHVHVYCTSFSIGFLYPFHLVHIMDPFQQPVSTDQSPYFQIDSISHVNLVIMIMYMYMYNWN